eukprot:5996972-Prymnesium_polylepis.1
MCIRDRIGLVGTYNRQGCARCAEPAASAREAARQDSRPASTHTQAGAMCKSDGGRPALWPCGSPRLPGRPHTRDAPHGWLPPPLCAEPLQTSAVCAPARQVTES